MSSYSVDIQTAPNGNGIGWLARVAKLPAELPDVEENMIRVQMTNTASFNAIVAVYEKHRELVFFTYDVPEGIINCTGATIDNWPID